jgi:hypothetical protein
MKNEFGRNVGHAWPLEEIKYPLLKEAHRDVIKYRQSISKLIPWEAATAWRDIIEAADQIIARPDREKENLFSAFTLCSLDPALPRTGTLDLGKYGATVKKIVTELQDNKQAGTLSQNAAQVRLLMECHNMAILGRLLPVSDTRFANQPAPVKDFMWAPMRQADDPLIVRVADAGFYKAYAEMWEGFQDIVEAHLQRFKGAGVRKKPSP